MKYIIAYVQVLSLICSIALAFPQNNQLSENNRQSSTTQGTTTECPCIATPEYNPVCGTDNVTYWNMGRFNCAKNCNPHPHGVMVARVPGS